MAERGLDDTDRRLLAALQADARASVRALAAELHISRANAYARLERLRADGVIRRFTVDVDPAALGLSTTAYVSVSLEQNAWRDVATALRALPHVVHVSLVGADFDALVHVRAPDNQALRDVVLGGIQSVPGVLSTRTWLVFDEFDGPADR